jgi:inactive STAND
MESVKRTWREFLYDVARVSELEPAPQKVFLRVFESCDPNGINAVPFWPERGADELAQFSTFQRNVNRALKKIRECVKAKDSSDRGLEKEKWEKGNANARRIMMLHFLQNDYHNPKYFRDQRQHPDESKKELELFLRRLNYKIPEVRFETELDEQLISKAFWVEVNGTSLTKKWLLHRLLYKITNHTSAKMIPIKASSYWDSRFELFWTALYEKLQDSRSPQEAWTELHNYCQDGPLIILIHEIDCLQDNETLNQLQSFWVGLVNELVLQDKAGVDRQDCIALFMSKSPPLSIFASPGYSKLPYGLLLVEDV